MATRTKRKATATKKTVGGVDTSALEKAIDAVKEHMSGHDPIVFGIAVGLFLIGVAMKLKKGETVAEAVKETAEETASAAEKVL